LPGLSPRSPVITDGPVLVTVEEPSTANFCAVPSEGAVWASAGLNRPIVRSEANNTTGPMFAKILCRRNFRVLGKVMVVPLTSRVA